MPVVNVKGLSGSLSVGFDPSEPFVNAHPVTSDNVSLVLASGGQTGVAVMVVGDGDKYVRGVVRDGESVATVEPVYVGVRVKGASSTTTLGLLGNSEGAIKIYDIAGGSITVVGITNTVGVHIVGTVGTLRTKLDPESVISGIQSTVRVNVGTIADTIKVRLDPGYELGSIKGINSTIQARIDPGYNVVNIASTIIIPITVSGSTSGGLTSGVTLVSPDASRNFKVYAIAITTTGVLSNMVRFTNGGGASPVEFWRTAMQAPSGVAAGIVQSVTPPAYLFSTGLSTTLALKQDNAQLIHYTVSLFKESA